MTSRNSVSEIGASDDTCAHAILGYNTILGPYAISGTWSLWEQWNSEIMQSRLHEIGERCNLGRMKSSKNEVMQFSSTMQSSSIMQSHTHAIMQSWGTSNSRVQCNLILTQYLIKGIDLVTFGNIECHFLANFIP